MKFRRAALIAIEVFGAKAPGVLNALIEALEKDDAPLIRSESAMLLGRMGADAKSTVSALGDALVRDKSEIVRAAAGRALCGKLNDYADGQLRALTDALTDRDEATRSAAAEALLKLGEKAAPAFASILAVARDAAKDRFSRLYALKMISRLGPDRTDAAEALVAVLKNRKELTSLREEAADGLGRMTVAIEKVIPPLSEGLSDPAPEVRRASAAALVRQGPDAKTAWPKVRIGLKDSDQAVRYQLVRLSGVLARGGEEPVTALLEVAHKDANIENRLAAIQELGQLPNHVARTERELESIAGTDIDTAVRNAADAALKKLRGM